MTEEEERELISGEVYSWFGQVKHGDCWKPCWLALTSTGWLKWYSERKGHLNGVAHLPAIADKILLEPRAQYKVNKSKTQAQVSEETLENLCSIVIVVRCRVKNLEERVSFAFENQQKLDKWLNAFLHVLHSSKVQWNDADLISYPNTWRTMHKYFCIDNFPEVNETACCGVSDKTLDEVIKNDKATTSRDQMVPRKLAFKKLDSQQNLLNSPVNPGGGQAIGADYAMYRDVMAMGWPS